MSSISTQQNPELHPSEDAYKLQPYFAVKDLAAEHFYPMFPAESPRAALRSVSMQLAAAPDALPAQYPQDFQLWFIGSLHMESGEFFGNPEFLSGLQALVAPVSRPGPQADLEVTGAVA